MAIPYNSILNQDWFSRLLQNVHGEANANIRRTGSDPTDPFWRAREAQGIGDLNKAQYEARQRLFENAGALNAAQRAKDKAYNERGSWGLKNMNPQAGPDTYLGVQGGDEGVIGPVPPALPPQSVPQVAPAPEAYAAPNSALYPKIERSGGVYRGYKQPPANSTTYSAYNPAKFSNPIITRRKGELEQYYAEMARGWR